MIPLFLSNMEMCLVSISLVEMTVDNGYSSHAQPVQTVYKRDGTVFNASGDSLPWNPMVSVVTGETVIIPHPIVRVLICTQILPIVLVGS